MPRETFTAYIALGGNLGDVKASFDSAVSMLEENCEIITRSKIYQTTAIGPQVESNEGSKAQPDYLNAAIKVNTSLSAAELLALLHQIEAKHDRVREVHWGARTLDLDLLAYEELISHKPELKLPHPEIQNRLFVLLPFRDIQGDWIHPISHNSISKMIQLRLDFGESLFEGNTWTYIR